MFIIISAFILTLLLGKTTYAFFNYTRTGTNNTIKVGRISFITRQLDTINLTNVFPIDRATIDNDTDNVDSVVIEIVGDTDYSGGIEYLVSSVDTNVSIARGSKSIDMPIGLDISIDDDLGEENNNYFTARESTNESIHKKLVGDNLIGDQMLLVGYIVPNSELGTPEGIDAIINIKAFLDKDKILISDTYDGTESDEMGTLNSMAEGKVVLTTTEWNSLRTSGISFKIKVEANEGIWVIGSLNDVMKKSAVMDNINSTFVNNSTPGINFALPSSDTNGKGVYTIASTENEDYPIMYYRGEVNDNNVLFANKCWKTVRTPDGTCSNIRFYYYSKYYTTLTDGVSIETALSNMKKNITNSTAKTTVDEWYQSNMLSYNNKIEDTIYCNDRSIVTPTPFSSNGELNRFLVFNGNDRITHGQPSLTCADRNDAFTVNNGFGNGMLTYPVALITSDELIYAGLHYDYDSKSFIEGVENYFTMTPFNTNHDDYILIGNATYGKSAEEFVETHSLLRPVISLKPNTRVVDGDGTEFNPYVIE